MNIFLKKLIGFSIGPVGGAIISFITIPLTTHFVSPEEFGKASMFSLFQILILSLLYLGIDQAYTREYHETSDKENLLKNAIVVPFIFAVMIFILISTNLSTVSNYLFGSPNYFFASLLFGLTIISMTLERFILLFIRMEEKALEYSIFNIVIKLTVLVFTILFVIFIRNDFLAVVYSSAIAQLFCDTILIIIYKTTINYKNFIFDKLLLIKLIRFGFPLIIAASLNNLLNSLDRISLRKWSSYNEIGIFTAALKISATLSIVQASFTSFWVPTAYRWYNQNKDIKHFEIISNGLLLIMSILFCFILLLKDLIVVLLSSDYINSKFIIGLLCLQPIMYTVSETTTLGIVFSKKSYLNIIVSLISIFPNIILNAILVPKYGAIGASIATGVSYIFFFFGRSYFSNKHWPGFSIKNHILVCLTIFLAALVNTQNYRNIFVINICTMLFVVIIQLPTIRKINLIYRLKGNKDWDFS
jgi:O-antigen/teichoic acid export membrane protein